VAIVQNITLFGVSTIFLILIGGNMNSLISSLTLHEYIFIFAGVLLLVVLYSKTMSEIAYLALFGVLASFIVGLVVIVEGLYKASLDIPSTTALDFSNFAVGFNIIVFSFGFHSVVPAIEWEMEEAEKFPIVANVGCSLIAAFYAMVMTAGYLGWGEDVDDNVLDSMDSSVWYVQVALVFITTHVTLAYPIPLNPVCLAVEDAVGVGELEGRQGFMARLPIRCGLVAGTVMIASVVPYFGDVLSFLTSISVVFTAFILPPLFYRELRSRAGNPLSTVETICAVVVMAVGVISSAAGLYFSTKNLIDDAEGGDPFSDYF